MSRYLRIRRDGEVKHLCAFGKCLTSPRCAVSKVAFYFLERRIVPSSKAQLSKFEKQSFSHWEKVALQRRMRAARPTRACCPRSIMEINLNSGGFLFPSSEEGLSRGIK